MGLGTSRYISSSQLISSIQGLQIYISSSIGNSGTNTFGAVFYLNYSAAVAPYSGLQTTTVVGSQIILSNVVTANSSSPIASFQTDYTLSPFIPPGIWDLNLFADSDTGKIPGAGVVRGGSYLLFVAHFAVGRHTAPY
jgi:hypothetical protein